MKPVRALAAVTGTVAVVLVMLVSPVAAAAPAPSTATSNVQASVPDQRLRPADSASIAVSCGYYSGTAITRQGHTGDRVREVQCLLVYWGYSVGPSGIDGDFGPATRNAVVAFQADTYGICGPPGLVDDGIVGPKTWSALRAPDSCPTV